MVEAQTDGWMDGWSRGGEGWLSRAASYYEGLPSRRGGRGHALCRDLSGASKQVGAPRGMQRSRANPARRNAFKDSTARVEVYGCKSEYESACLMPMFALLLPLLLLLRLLLRPLPVRPSAHLLCLPPGSTQLDPAHHMRFPDGGAVSNPCSGRSDQIGGEPRSRSHHLPSHPNHARVSVYYHRRCPTDHHHHHHRALHPSKEGKQSTRTQP